MSWNEKSPVFEILDTRIAEMMPQVIGLWSTNPGITDGTVSFTLNSETDVDVPLWRANFPSDLSKATLHLTHSEGIVIQTQKALVTAVDRIHRLIQSIHAQSDLSFDLSSVTEVQIQPEHELLSALQEIQKPYMPTSFGIGQEIASLSEQIFKKFQSFMEHLLHIVSHYTWVETRIEGRTLARTYVSWLGDVNSIWQTGLSVTQVSLHQRTLSLALASRDALLQIFCITLQTALKLSAFVNVPGGLILVLPIAWQFIDRVITQFKDCYYEHI